MRVRVATAEDAVAILKFMFAYAYPEYAEKFAPPDVEQSWSFLQHVLQHGRVWVAETKDGKMIGTIAAVIDNYPWSKQCFIGDVWNFVAPQARSSRAGVKLLKALIAYADELGIPCRVGVTTGEDLLRKENFLGYHGFKKIGGLYERK